MNFQLQLPGFTPAIDPPAAGFSPQSDDPAMGFASCRTSDPD